MSKVKIIGEALKIMPWQDKPEGFDGVLWRHDGNPIIGWNNSKHVSRIFNSAVVAYEGAFVGVFRADHKNVYPHLHFGKSRDGLKWEIDAEPIKWKDTSGKPFNPEYAYDPRLVKIDDAHYIIFCTDFGGAPTLGLGMTKDFKEFIRLENVCVPCNRNGVLFPRRINDRFYMLNRPSDTGHTPFGDIYISESFDLTYWGKHRKVMTKGGYGWWQDLKIGPGAVPIETNEGWLLFYHGVVRSCNGYIYSIGAAILDIDNPAKVLYRTSEAILTPETAYETVGFVQNVAFPCATLHDAETGRIALYYGAADTYVAVAYAQAEELVDFIKENSVLVAGDAEEVR